MEAVLRKPTMFRLRTDLLEKLKELAKLENRSFNNYVESVLLDIVSRAPNKETLEAYEEARRGEYAGTIDLTSIESMINSIEG